VGGEPAAHERKAKEEQEARERPFKEAVQREEAEEREAKLQAEREAREAALVRCVVPSLKGRSLADARDLLHKAHCRLGNVSKPGRGSKGRLVVREQRVKAGRRLPSGTRVGVVLSWALSVR
jgi:hypothetical protein